MDFLLCGTDSGEIHVFNTRTRESIGVIALPVPWAQVIAVRCRLDFSNIANKSVDNANWLLGGHPRCQWTRR